MGTRCLALFQIFVLYSSLTAAVFQHSSIDPDTSSGVLTTTRRHDGKTLHLRASDEFNLDGRGFGPGEDPWFEAIEKPDETNQAIQFYNSSKEYVTTKDGTLTISTRAVKTNYTMWVEDGDFNGTKQFTKNYTSGMVQSWNKFCFTGGVLEMRIQLPGHVDSGGIWPAAWLMGNLARATYTDSVMYQWPWSYSKCRGDSVLPGFDPFGKQEINACDPDPGYGLHPYQGRGSPEIDIFEVMPGHEMPGQGEMKAFMSSSLQVSPGLPAKNRPVNGYPLDAPVNKGKEWYGGLKKAPRGRLNDGFWGQECGPEDEHQDRHKTSNNRLHKWYEDVISVNTRLEKKHFEDHHTYRVEWQPGSSSSGTDGRRGDGYLEWWLDDEFLFGIEGASLQELTGAEIPFEPMYMIFNTAISHRWGMPEPCPKDQCGACWMCYDCTNPECQCSLPDGMKGCKNLPAAMSIDWIRLYQDPEDSEHTFGCSPPQYPTREFIQAHSERYMNWRPYDVNGGHGKKGWFPGMTHEIIHEGEDSVSHFLQVIRNHFNIYLFPLFLVWVGIGVFIGIKFCRMTEELEVVREVVRNRLDSIEGHSSHGNLYGLDGGSDTEPSPDRRSIEAYRRAANKAFFGIESPARPAKVTQDDITGEQSPLRKETTQQQQLQQVSGSYRGGGSYQSIEMSQQSTYTSAGPPAMASTPPSASGGTSLWGGGDEGSGVDETTRLFPTRDDQPQPPKSIERVSKNNNKKRSDW